MNKSIKKLQIFSVIFVFFLGTLMHFVYEWSGNLSTVGAFAPVNESVWEHLKLVLWPTIIFSLFQYLKLKHNVKNFWIGKLLNILISMAIIPMIFYFYTTFTGHSILFIDILTFLIAIIIGHYIDYKFMIKKGSLPVYDKFYIIGIMIIIFIFILFTFYPPHLPIFMDSITKSYGIS